MNDPAVRATEREALAMDTLVQLVDSLVDDFDVIDMLTLLAHRTVELLRADAAGILLADDRQKLRLVAASDENVELLELFQLQNDEGPCLDGFRTGEVITEGDLTSSTAWPVFAPEAVRHGYAAVCAVPMRLRSDVMGCLNIFMRSPGVLSDRDIALGQALADVSTIAMMQDRALRDSRLRQEQLQSALDSRVVIEQAKGMIAERADVDVASAFEVLRRFARRHRLGLTDVSSRLMRREIQVADLVDDEGADQP